MSEYFLWFNIYIYIKQTAAFSSWVFMKVIYSTIRCNSWNLQSLISRCSNTFFQWEVNLLLSNVTFNVVLQTLAVKGYLNMWWIEILKRECQNLVHQNFRHGTTIHKPVFWTEQKTWACSLFQMGTYSNANKPFYISFP